jgi:hypothetical protein
LLLESRFCGISVFPKAIWRNKESKKILEMQIYDFLHDLEESYSCPITLIIDKEYLYTKEDIYKGKQEEAV